VTAHGPDSGSHDHHGAEPADLVRIAFVAVAAAAVWFRVWEPLEHVSVLGIAATLIGGWPIFRQAFADILARRMTMELSMTIALLAALVIGEFFTVLVIVFFVLVAEVLEGLTVDRGRHAIGDLLDLLPRTVLVRRGDAVVEIEPEALRPDELVVVRPGTRVPVDGVVVSGHSFLDQSPITGESLPVEKIPGASVYAGTVNQSGVLEVRATGRGRETAFGRILEAVERAEVARAPIQKIADRLAGYLVYFALACAALTFLVTRDVRATIAVVIVAGACGIAAGTPLAILGAIGRAARQGAIVKGGIHLETLSQVDTVVLDKTGTLTFGNPEVVGVRTPGGGRAEEVLETAAIAERASEHPLAKAILRRVDAASLPLPERFDYTPGEGIAVRAAGADVLVGRRRFLEAQRVAWRDLPDAPQDGSQVFVARDGRLLGVVDIADTLRPEAEEAIRTLRGMGLRTVLLSGDARPIAQAVGARLGVDEVGADLLPEDKVERVRALLAGGRRVAMVGDGINDAPALMQASVGIAMGSGTDAARESADVLLIGNDLLKLVETLRIARWCRRIILFNFGGTLLVDAVGVALAAAGLLSPLLAAFIHVSSELAFILNSARLLPRGAEEAAAGGTNAPRPA